MGFLMAALTCFNLLAWPLFSLGFPLYASVRAIETNSMQEMRDLVAYWILFSLISIFELAFGKLIQWLPFWPYIKLITICWLVLPWFNGAGYVYEHLIHRCLSVNPEELVNLLFKPKKNTSLDAERFLSMAEKYVKENGCEALEKLIARKPEHRNPDVDMEEIKAVTNTEEKGTAAAMLKVPDAVKGNAKAVELTAKNSDAATKRSPPKVPNVAKENAKAGELKEKDLAATERSHPKGPDVAEENAKSGEVMKKDLAAIERVKYVEPNLAQTEKYTVASSEIKEKKTAPAEKPVMEEPASSEKVQREWTCAVCQVTTTCEKILNSHLQGKKHKAKCERLKASEKTNSGDDPSPSKPKKRRTKRQREAAKQNINELWCGICNDSYNSQIDLESHLRGEKHLLQIQETLGSLDGWESCSLNEL
ncbi:uncharacterized protein LOC127801664 isoform X5 [Diospyros lotus]|uniref:uncharacterized protein LOC127801664 isoform X5 n=1 Tax=Diospyros lotus TaxID=55363 RepID=UPI0022532D6A|nr:uncharacterized protein LOC127801664 isoform X5 [Diospyros lotus]